MKWVISNVYPVYKREKGQKLRDDHTVYILSYIAQWPSW